MAIDPIKYYLINWSTYIIIIEDINENIAC